MIESESVLQAERRQAEADEERRMGEYTLKFRDECKEEKEDFLQRAEDWFNNCVNFYDTADGCLSSEVHTTVYLPEMVRMNRETWLSECIEGKMTEMGLE